MTICASPFIRRIFFPLSRTLHLTMKSEAFGDVDGRQVDKYTLDNGKIKTEIITYGGAIRALLVPDRNGKQDDIVLGFDNIDGYLSKKARNPYFGCIVGRVANRIGKATFKLNDKVYELEKNNGENALHGGLKAFDKVVWNASILDDNSLGLAYFSPAGENGYPGDLMTNVTYTLTSDNELQIVYRALTNEATPVNLTNHTYFNLGGHNAGSEELYKHLVQINANHVTPVDADNLIPTGDIAAVTGTPFDLTAKDRLGDKILNLDPIPGFDHNFCINKSSKYSFDLACTLEHPTSGRKIECFTNQPGMQFYTGNFLPTSDNLEGKEGAIYKKHGAFCLETQNYPDAINQLPKFPNPVLLPGQLYEHRTTFKFGLMTK